VFAIVATGVALVMHFDINNLFDMASGEAVGASSMLPLGWYGVWAALPFAMWLFLAVEGVPLAAEEAKDPARDVPRGIIGAMLFLLFTALLVVVLVPGAAGSTVMGSSEVPLVDALNATGQPGLATLVNLLGLAGLVASFFSIIYGYSRLVFALSRAGYLPTSLSLTTERKVPARALIIPGVFGFLASLSGEGDLMLAMAVVGATVSYALMAGSHILLRVKQPNMPRPYRTPGGVMTSGVALLLSLVALTGVYAFDPRAFFLTMGLFIVGAVYYFGYSRNHLVAKSADEEFAMLAAAEADLAAV
jgi:ethanolamine permease